MRRAIVAISLFLLITNPVTGQGQPCVYPRMDLVDARLRAKVAKIGDRFQYHYMMQNGPGAQQVLDSFAIEALAGPGGVVTQVRPPDWRTGRIARTLFSTWDALGSAGGLPAGTSTRGFGFADADLPAIARFLVWAHVEPPEFPEGMAPDFCENANVLENSFKGRTVGPRPPQEPFVAIEFLNFLITLVHDSRQLGWIKVDGVQQSLLAKLINAKRKLEAGETIVAKNMLNVFLNEVQATSCPEFTCPGNKPLTSEALALLFFNGQFLVERLR